MSVNFLSLPRQRGHVFIRVCVCVFVCLIIILRKTIQPIFTKFDGMAAHGKCKKPLDSVVITLGLVYVKSWMYRNVV